MKGKPMKKSELKKEVARLTAMLSGTTWVADRYHDETKILQAENTKLKAQLKAQLEAVRKVVMETPVVPPKAERLAENKKTHND